LIIPASVLSLLSLLVVYGGTTYLAIHSLLTDLKVNVSQVQQKRVRRIVCVFVDVLYWLPGLVVLINLY
jgi:hypothetical protein